MFSRNSTVVLQVNQYPQLEQSNLRTLLKKIDEKSDNKAFEQLQHQAPEIAETLKLIKRNDIDSLIRLERTLKNKLAIAELKKVDEELLKADEELARKLSEELLKADEELARQLSEEPKRNVYNGLA